MNTTYDYHEILGLPKDASQDDIKQKFRELSKKYHPDVNSDSNAATMFRLINDAYRGLTEQEQGSIHTEDDAYNRQESSYHEASPPHGQYRQAEERDEYGYEKYAEYGGPIRSRGIGLVVLKVLFFPVYFLLKLLGFFMVFVAGIATVLGTLVCGLGVLLSIVTLITSGLSEPQLFIAAGIVFVLGFVVIYGAGAICVLLEKLIRWIQVKLY